MKDVRDLAPDGSREKYLDISDVAHIAQEMQERDEKIRLHPEDAVSVKLWMDRLRDNNAVMGTSGIEPMTFS